ncbi:polysaccharide biosynthesis tyrosine autokinase [Tamlana sp. 2_MG-2023]|uniref:GumC family protein n=1 Tax=unclassified Tamlana TaxID=2614803 RepID=UPI0026E34824|nr:MULTISPECIES: polysaccharide biosynthesis tyrosine autokinase [unclassified Tamlana]MDO6760258.1 polysaccharide biosynthesis tyrosine autokinase [Tamlana sp. 2_MG-2023]MDO6790044.1 polysaccharide biosynthesis tyrosine autokinase [Tamlana sp. 1_MG-2023]
MQNQDTPQNLIVTEEQSTNIRQEIEKYAYHWKWIVLCVFLALIGAYFYLRYTPNTYEGAATILMADEANGGAPNLDVFKELGLGSDKKNITNEITILKSRSLMERVVKNLNFNISYFKEGNLKTSEFLKGELPFRINFLTPDSLIFKTNTAFKIHFLSPKTFELTNTEGENNKPFNFGERINYNGIEAIITPKSKIQANDIFTIRIAPVRSVAENLRNRVEIALLTPGASVLELKMQSQKQKKILLILEELVHQYNKDAVEYKSLVGNNTNAFIKERLALIEKDLIKVDKNTETFKTTNKLTDIATETSIVLSKNTTIENEIIEMNTQLKLIDYVKDYLKDNENNLIPGSFGLNDSNISATFNQYNTLLFERNRISESTSDNNPIIVNLNTQLKQIRESIILGLDNLKSSLNVTLRDAMAQEQIMASRIATAPRMEREFRDIERQQQIIETLYLFLLQKREENAISLAVTAPNAKLIDSAEGTVHSIGPNRNKIYLTALVLGLGIPIGIIFLFNLLDNKVHTQKELEETIKAPFIGAIPTTLKKDRMLTKDDRGGLAEAFRMVRTNLNFMLGNIDSPSKAIFVTSTTPGEGKTFVAINLATVFAMTGKKVLLIGADIRKPKVIEYLNINSSNKGLTEYLADNSIAERDIIEPLEWGFDLIQSGIIAPNPAELLMNGRLDALLAYSKQNYDYVIVDTAPVTLVTDTIQIASKADMFLYITRANYLDKRLLDVPKQLYNEKRLPNMALVMNGTDPKKGYGYGYGGYGYGNDEEKTPWWRFNK